jgi:hypothetical protein
VVPVGLALLTGSTIWMATMSPDTSRWVIAAMLAGRGVGIGLAMMPAMSSAYITLAPSLISRATSISNTVQRVAGGLGVAILATILTGRIAAHLPPLPAGASASVGGNLASSHLPAALKTMLEAQVARGFDDTFWVAAGLSLVAFPMAVLLRRPLRPEVVRAFALRQLGEGIVLGAAARRLDARAGARNGTAPRVESRAAQAVLTEGARARLGRGFSMLRAGTNAAGLVPQPPVSPVVRAVFVLTLVAALVGTAVLIAHGYQAATVPRLPLPVGTA